MEITLKKSGLMADNGCYPWTAKVRAGGRQENNLLLGQVANITASSRQ